MKIYWIVLILKIKTKKNIIIIKIVQLNFKNCVMLSLFKIYITIIRILIKIIAQVN
jgi:hypothetical protein